MRCSWILSSCALLMVLTGCEFGSNFTTTAPNHQLAWMVETDTSYPSPPVTMPLIDEDCVYVANGKYIEKRALEDGHLVWQVNPGEYSTNRSRNFLLVDDVVILQVTITLQGVDRTTGEHLWVHQFDGYLQTGAPLLSMMDGQVFMGGINEIIIVDVLSQTNQRWDISSYFNDEQNRYVYRVIPDSIRNHVIIPIEYYDEEESIMKGEVLCLDASSGEEIWKRTESNMVTLPSGENRILNKGCYSGLIDDDILYFNTQYSIVSANATNGTTIWETIIPGAMTNTSPAMYKNNIYTGTHLGEVMSINSQTGDLSWVTNLGYTIITAFSFYRNEAYVGIFTGSDMYILDSDNGNLNWSSVNKEYIANDIVTPVGVGNGYSVVVGSEYIYCHEIVD
jgi:outer membrane protein assembly factor BamB